MARYVTIHTIERFAICRASDSPNLYLATYDRETQKSVRTSLRTDDLELALALVRSLVERRITGDLKAAIAQRPIRTVGEVLEFNRAHVEAQASAEFGRIAIERMQRLFGGSQLQTMVKSDFDHFRDLALQEGLELTTIDRTSSILRTAIRMAVAERRLPAHHAPKVPYYATKNILRAAPAKGPRMEIEEIAAAIDEADFLHFLLAMVYLINLGCRIGALLDAVSAQIDQRHGLIHLNRPGRVQTSKWRPTLPLTLTLQPWTIGLPEDHIIRWRGEKVGEIDSAFAAACRRAKVTVGNTYSVRHALGRHMRAAGVPDAQIALWLGHIQPPTAVETTLIYSPYEPAYLCEAKAAAESFVRKIAALTHRRDVLRPPWLD